MRLVLGADHAGYLLKAQIVEKLRLWGHEVLDVGVHDESLVDFPDVAMRLCAAVTDGRADRGIIVCGTGIGASMAANRCRGIRAALAHDLYSAHQCVEHDNANVLCLGAQVIGPLVALDLVRIFLDASFSTDEEFRRRVEKLDAMRATEAPPR